MRVLTVGFAIVLATASSANAAGDRIAGAKVMPKCQVCHGKDGLAKLPEAPNIAGQKESYLIRVLKAFKSGERQSPQMGLVAKGLSDEDIANIAAYYASIKITVEIPP